jgi:hypothetical protein
MSAQVIEFASAFAVRARRMPMPKAAPIAVAAAGSPEFKFWIGASGKRYVHTIHRLIGCPEIENCTFILVGRLLSGRRQILRIGRLENDTPSLNLAEIRQLGATLGATEVHVHLLAKGVHQRRSVELDLCAFESDVVTGRTMSI